MSSSSFSASTKQIAPIYHPYKFKKRLLMCRVTRRLELFISATFFVPLCFSCGVTKYYEYEQPNEEFIYKDSLITINLASLVPQDAPWYSSYVRVKKETSQTMNIDYIKSCLVYYDSGKMYSTKTEELQVAITEERLRQQIKPPAFENVPDELQEMSRDWCTLFNYELSLGINKQIPTKVRTVYLIDSIGYSVGGRSYHFAKKIELLRKTHRYFWLLRDD